MVEASLDTNNSAGICLHCGQSVPQFRRDYCCQGCEIVAKLLREADLTRFYDLKPKSLLPQINYFTRTHDYSWLDSDGDSHTGSLAVSIEGLQCAACVWVVREIARRLDPGTRVDVDLVLGRLSLLYNPEKFSPREYAEKLFKFGYRIKKQLALDDKRNDGLLVRLGVCSAISMNTMFLAISIYSGLNKSDPQIYELISKLNFYLTFVSVIVGGSYFFQKAYATLRQGILHFDLTITLGILTAFIGSMSLYFSNRGGDSYFDTINIFITLMLAGRFIQEKVIEKNRHTLMLQDEFSDLKILRSTNNVGVISFKDIQPGDELIVSAGGIVPVQAILLDGQAEFSLSWITGESIPHIYRAGEKVQAGAQLASQSSIKLKALEAYERSPLTQLQPTKKSDTFLYVVWQWVISRYVILVLIAAFSGYLSWLFIDSSKALNVLTAILVVTCPCSLGIAVPMAQTMADYSLRKKGVFVRNMSCLDKLTRLRKIFFDKTGTLTLSILQWINKSDCVLALSNRDSQVLYSMAMQSRHPASLSVFQALSGDGQTSLELSVTDHPGVGLSTRYEGDEYTLGAISQTDNLDSNRDYVVTFCKNREKLCSLVLQEELLDNSTEIINFIKNKKIQVALISGDKLNRVANVASQLNVDDFLGGLSPQDKATIVSMYTKQLPDGQASLVVGDGLNDARAFNEATIAGTPFWDYSNMAQGADFFYLSTSLTWLKDLLLMARRLKGTIQMNLMFSLFFNLAAIGFALTGRLTPLLAAILMPVGSLGILSFTMRRMKRAF